jgi:Domain of unknown function (DUF4388)
MAVEGELKDIDITSVIQVLCTERRQAGLVVRRRGEEGVIFFDRGEIVHATLGPIEGEEAVYQLLSWQDGNFRMTDKVRAPVRTIAMQWSHLLMEGMRKIDEHRRDRGVAPPRAAAGFVAWTGVDNDAALESELMLLLSQLEQSMTRLGEDKVRKRPRAAIDTLCGMVNHLIACAEQRLDVGEGKLALQPLLAQAARHHPMARLLTVHQNRLSAQTVANLYSAWSDDPAERREMFREICRSIERVTESYLDLFARQGRSPATAEAWRESYGVFLRDLALAIDRIRF